jgi:hypothetical protein
VYKGRPASISDAAEVRAMKAQGLGVSEIAKALKFGRVLVYRVLIKTRGRSALWSKEIWLPNVRRCFGRPRRCPAEGRRQSSCQLTLARNSKAPNIWAEAGSIWWMLVEHAAASVSP